MALLRRLPRPTPPCGADLVAGLTVAMVLIPQSIAYAALAGMPPVSGLYSAAMAPLLAGVVGSSPYLQTGPTAVTSLLVAGSLAPLGPVDVDVYVAHAAVLTLLVGGSRLALGLLRGGFVAYLMSQPVVAGFTLGASVIIAAAQLPAALGTTPTGGNPIAAASWAISAPDGWSVAAMLMSVGVIAVTLLARRLHPLFPGALVATVAALLVVRSGVDVDVVGDIPSGLPAPALDLPWTAMPSLLLPALVIALVGFAEPASIAREYASADRSSWDPDRELVGQGLANLGAGAFGGFAVGGSFSRSALNRLSGARTRWSGALAGATVLATLPFASVLSGLPTAALAGLVIASVLGLLNPLGLIRTWRYSRPQFVIAVVTIAVSLAAAPSVQWGVVAGVALALGVHLWRELRLEVDSWVEHDLLHVRPQGVLYFGSAPALETRILAELAEQPRLSRVEIHLQRLGRIDLTGALVLRSICRDLAGASVPVQLSGVQPQCRGLLDRVLAGEGIDYTHGPRNTVSPAYPARRRRPSDSVASRGTG
ncbi:MAG: SulP family inorganic anion transporter [Nocardioides sp.]|nr:SulP family inorganic anion transporter [Nocardioides sp.]